MVSFSKIIIGIAIFQWIIKKKNPIEKLFTRGIPFLSFYFIWRLIRKRYLAWPTPPPGASIFITGADTGIGRATALHLNALGYHIFCGVLKEANGAKLKNAAKFPNMLTPVICDVTKIQQIKEAAALCSSHTGGRLWGLVNNAGIFASDGPVEFLPQKRVDDTMAVNFWGVWHVTRAFLPLIRASKGRIVNIASICGFFCWPGNASYCISKHGVEALTDCLRMDIYRLGCMVSVFEPGGIKTNIYTYTKKILTDCWNEMGPDCWKVYGKLNINKLEKKTNGRETNFTPPKVVAQDIEHALCSPYPKLRYRMGRGAGIIGAAKEFLSDRTLYHATQKIFKTPIEEWEPTKNIRN